MLNKENKHDSVTYLRNNNYCFLFHFETVLLAVHFNMIHCIFRILLQYDLNVFTDMNIKILKLISFVEVSHFF